MAAIESAAIRRQGPGPGIICAELMALDLRPTPAIATDQHFEFLGPGPNPRRYTSEDFARAERAKIRPHVWQIVAGEEKPPRADDYGVLGEVFEQNIGNLPLVQEALHRSNRGQAQLAEHQEIRIRQVHRVFDKYLSSNSGGKA